MAESRETRQDARRPIAFISHHSSQDQVARHLKAVLARHGVEGWMAPDDIEPGVSFDHAIIDQLRRSDMIILLFCARSDQSKHVKRELMLAEDQNMLVYPVRLEAIEPAGLAYWLQDYQWTDWIDRRDATIEAMVATAKRQVAAADAASRAETEAATAEPLAPPPASDAAPAPPVAAASLPVGPLPAPRERPGLGRNGWIAIGVIGALLVIVLGLGTFTASSGPDSSDRESAASNDDGQDDPGIAANDFETAGVAFFRPGEWRSTSWLNELDAPGLPAAARDQMLQQLNAVRETSTQCVTAEEAANPEAGFFNLDEEGSCTPEGTTIANGRIEVAMSCIAPGMSQPTRISMEGSYTPDEYTLNLTTTTDLGAQGGMITMRGVATGEHLGDCGG